MAAANPGMETGTRTDRHRVDTRPAEARLVRPGMPCGAETTKLALQAAAAGLAVVEVQPVNADGPVPLAAAGGGGCGSGGVWFGRLRQSRIGAKKPGIPGNHQHGIIIHE